MSQKIRIGIVALFVATAAVVGVGGAVSVRAHEVEESETEHVNTTTTTTSNDSHKNNDERLSEVKQRVQGRLDEAKKKTCNARVTAITKIMANAAAAGKRHEEVFGKILARVEEFYTNKKLTVANYDALVAAANAKKEAATAAVAAVANNVAFDCNSDNPVSVADAFSGKVKAMRQALKDYRTAIGALLKAVKQAAEAAQGSAQQ
jgi:hypothetical protein